MPDSLNVALWGPSAAGKTAFLAQLFRRYSNFASEWEIFPTADANRFLEIVGSEIDRNCFPKATVVSDTISNVAYLFRHRNSGKEVALVVEDRPGIESEELTEEGKKRLNEAHGLILIFDPERERRSLESQIEQTLRKLYVAANRGTQKDERPIAVCLSKADRLIETAIDLQRAVDSPREFVLEKITSDLAAWLGRYCRNYELFPISSAGVRLRHGIVEPAIFLDEQLMLRMGSEGEPINLMAPFEWLFDRIGTDQNGGRL